jgi:CheY-like chemotaxis protein
MDHKQVSILLVEDDDVDAELVVRAFRKLKIANPIVMAKDGIEALSHLRGEEGYTGIQPPFLILLDINMPRMNGHEFLAELRADPKLHDSIVFVLTTSSAEKDRLAAYNYNIAGYLLKSSAGEDFSSMLSMLDHYWRFVEFPIQRAS